MAKIEWDEGYNLGIKSIDDQHRAFVGLLNELYESITDGKTKEHLSRIITELLSYIEYHFALEERYFDEFNYEGKKEHIDFHRDLAAKTVAYKEKFENGEDGVDMAWEMVDFLEDWLINHLDIADKKYVKCFKEHGLE